MVLSLASLSEEMRWRVEGTEKEAPSANAGSAGSEACVVELFERTCTAAIALAKKAENLEPEPERLRLGLSAVAEEAAEEEEEEEEERVAYAEESDEAMDEDEEEEEDKEEEDKEEEGATTAAGACGCAWVTLAAPPFMNCLKCEALT